MPTLQARIPKYRKHRASGQAVVTLAGRDYYLGPYGSQASRDAYDRHIAEFLANGRQTQSDDPAGVTVAELLNSYRKWAEGHYRKRGEPTSELHLVLDAMKPLNRLYGPLPAAEFGPRALKAVRETMIDEKWARQTVNAQIGRIRRIFRWGVENELVAAPVYQALMAVTGLQAGRCRARETEPVKPVPEAFIEAVKPFVTPQLWAMVQLQLLTGMRPGEVRLMRGADINMTGAIWEYRPQEHKSEHHGIDRVIAIGPRAQAVLKPFLKSDLHAYLFTPGESQAARSVERRANRKSPMTPSQRARRAKGRKYLPYYSKDAYQKVVRRACDLADAAAREKAAAEGRETNERLVPRWHPNQLRHNAATIIRRQAGLDAAQAVLGHKQAQTTQIYAELDAGRAREIARQIG